MALPRPPRLRWIALGLVVGCLIGLVIQEVRLSVLAFSSMCETEVAQLHPSPDGARILVVSVMACGAAGADRTVVRIVKAGEGVASGHAWFPFKQSETSQTNIFEMRDWRKLRIRWQGARTVEITVPMLSTVHTKLPTAGDVRIVYK